MSRSASDLADRLRRTALHTQTTAPEAPPEPHAAAAAASEAPDPVTAAHRPSGAVRRPVAPSTRRFTLNMPDDEWLRLRQAALDARLDASAIVRSALARTWATPRARAEVLAAARRLRTEGER